MCHCVWFALQCKYWFTEDKQERGMRNDLTFCKYFLPKALAPTLSAKFYMEHCRNSFKNV